MCHICDRLGIEIESPPAGKTDEEIAAEEEAAEREWVELEAQGQPLPEAPCENPGYRVLPPTKVVVEPAPSHDGAPTFAAYSVFVPLLDVDEESEDGVSNSPPTLEPEKHRPIFGIRIYDTTADATPERAGMLARRISELTYWQRVSSESGEEDRIEVVVMPMDVGTTAEERAARCIVHNEAEREERLAMADAAVAKSWYLAEDFYDGCCRKQIWVINDLKEDWEKALRQANARRPHWGPAVKDTADVELVHGGQFLNVGYDRTDSYDPEVEEVDENGRPLPEFFARGYSLEKIGEWLSEFRGVRGNVYMFFQTHFIPDGVLDKELALARAAAAGIEVERPVVIPYTERHGYEG